MQQVAIKFCGGCNPRYDRGAAYATLRESLADTAVCTIAEDGVDYAALVIFRGCTGCDYQYENIHAHARFICADECELDAIIAAVRQECASLTPS